LRRFWSLGSLSGTSGECLGGIRERCEKNLEHNGAVAGTKALLKEHPEMRTAALEAKIKEAGQDRFRFACEK
jgi:hypothetical protein